MHLRDFDSQMLLVEKHSDLLALISSPKYGLQFPPIQHTGVLMPSTKGKRQVTLVGVSLSEFAKHFIFVPGFIMSASDRLLVWWGPAYISPHLCQYVGHEGAPQGSY